jgi:hypothetical protein
MLHRLVVIAQQADAPLIGSALAWSAAKGGYQT